MDITELVPSGERRYEKGRKQWVKFHQENPQVYEMMVHFADLALKAGRKKLSHWLLLNRVRWYGQFETSDQKRGGFKISNNHFQYYARAYMMESKERENFLHIKACDGEDFELTRMLCGIPPRKERKQRLEEDDDL